MFEFDGILLKPCLLQPHDNNNNNNNNNDNNDNNNDNNDNNNDNNDDNTNNVFTSLGFGGRRMFVQRSAE